MLGEAVDEVSVAVAGEGVDEEGGEGGESESDLGEESVHAGSASRVACEEEEHGVEVLAEPGADEGEHAELETRHGVEGGEDVVDLAVGESVLAGDSVEDGGGVLLKGELEVADDSCLVDDVFLGESQSTTGVGVSPPMVSGSSKNVVLNFDRRSSMTSPPSSRRNAVTSSAGVMRCGTGLFFCPDFLLADFWFDLFFFSSTLAISSRVREDYLRGWCCRGGSAASS